ncbi:MAG: response regulator [Bdellovibrionota bacterium]
MDNIRILLVEDEPEVLDALATSLERKGFNVLRAVDGEDALTGDKISQANLVISDIRMPRVGGAELYNRARQLRPELPFIFISGHTIELNRISNQLTEPLPILLQKPFSIEQLLQAVEQQLKTSE